MRDEKWTLRHGSRRYAGVGVVLSVRFLPSQSVVVGFSGLMVVSSLPPQTRSQGWIAQTHWFPSLYDPFEVSAVRDSSNT